MTMVIIIITTTTTIFLIITIILMKSNLGKGVCKHFMLASLTADLSEQGTESGHLGGGKVVASS